MLGVVVAALGHALLAGACGARSELLVPDPCAGQASVGAQLSPLDVVIMIDNSGSMAFLAEPGLTRQDAVERAFADFFAQPESAGISVSLGYFPVIDETIAEACDDDETCGEPGACQPFRACAPSGGGACRDDVDCERAGFPGDTCEQLGFCDDRTTSCRVGWGGCPGGPCLPLGHCDNHYTCDAAGYARPLVPMQALPEGAQAVLAALTKLTPVGSTPTLPALGGAIEQATTWAASHPDHHTIVVLATDGLPTACDPEIQSGDPQIAIDNLSATAAAGLTAGVRTFVVGLATPIDGTARDDLDAIAAAGGTESAFIVGATIVDELVDALASVRLDAGACTFTIAEGVLSTVAPSARVRLELPSGERPYVPWRSSLEACGAGPGFYLDPPFAPRRVMLCPATCERFGSSLLRRIEVFTECPS